MIATAPKSLPIEGQMEVLLPTALGHGFDYGVPTGLALYPGAVVRVPFGRSEALGVVWGQGTAKLPVGKIKPVIGVLDTIPPLSAELMEFIGWAAWYNCAPLGAVLKMALPLSDMDKPTRDSVKAKLFSEHAQALKLAALNNDQEKAAKLLEKTIGGGFNVTLLDGVTGSGKTEVYFQAIAAALQANKKAQALVLLPEIALTVQWLERFESRFGFKPLVWNSQITPAQKRASLQAIMNGEARVIVGARSALFLPYESLALLVVDEEHDASYKQEEGVIYHARDMAVARARFEKIPAVLVSATPSLESHHNARQGKYQEITLSKRHGEAELPEVAMLDMRKAPLERGAFVSNKLREVLKQTVASGHQAMLFLNRRGYAPLMLCRHCGHRFQCPDCSSWLVMHRSKPRLECHHCGYTLPPPKTCPACEAKDSLHACGPGVERLQEEVSAFLPKARVAVMASDHMQHYRELEATINAMEKGEIDILIGTQMVAKGHHFAGLAAVGVVDADLGLAGGDLRAAERTYQLLHQLSGRAGREQIRGKVYLQSYLPEHPVMQALMSGDRDAFLAAELDARKAAHMPPFTRLAAIIVEGKKEDAVIKTAKALASRITNHESRVTLLGPAPAPLYRLRDKYRWRLLLRAERQVNLPDFIRGWLEAAPTPSSVRVKVDIDPVNFL